VMEQVRPWKLNFARGFLNLELAVGLISLKSSSFSSASFVYREIGLVMIHDFHELSFIGLASILGAGYRR
jgi:hypothetical protein